MESRLFKYVFVDKNGNRIEENVWAYSEIDADRRAGEIAFRKAYVDYYPIIENSTLRLTSKDGKYSVGYTYDDNGNFVDEWETLDDERW